MRVCIAAGGTGGHLLPGVAAGRELRARGHQVHFIVRADGATPSFLAKEGFASSAFAYAGFPRRLSWRLLTFPALSLTAYLNARRILRREEPDAVLGMGGYMSLPVGLAAVRLNIPLVIHEQNSLAGLANRVLASRARAVAISFPDTRGLPRGARLIPTGLPLRPDLEPKDPAQARRSLGLDAQAFTVLVFGGSQGARALNRLVASALSRLAKQGEWQFIHLTGPADHPSMEAAYRDAGYRAFVKPYWNDMATLYSAADFVISRSGANTVMELARMGRPALLIPFPHATGNHQEINARFLERAGGAQVALERDLTLESLLDRLRSIPPADAFRAENPAKPRALAGLTDGAARLADVVEEAGRP
jgi:UDP-N-acetylglucosamine--N-acetylmuramyl-(pentapeptide) pyrophosphoryl-undecaprenol N-acetylglucosamine transferase